MITGVTAGEGVAVGFGVRLPVTEERFDDCCAAWIFLRNALRRALAPSTTSRASVHGT